MRLCRRRELNRINTQNNTLFTQFLNKTTTNILLYVHRTIYNVQFLHKNRFKPLDTADTFRFRKDDKHSLLPVRHIGQAEAMRAH